MAVEKHKDQKNNQKKEKDVDKDDEIKMVDSVVKPSLSKLYSQTKFLEYGISTMSEFYEYLEMVQNLSSSVCDELDESDYKLLVIQGIKLALKAEETILSGFMVEADKIKQKKFNTTTVSETSFCGKGSQQPELEAKHSEHTTHKINKFVVSRGITHIRKNGHYLLIGWANDVKGYVEKRIIRLNDSSESGTEISMNIPSITERTMPLKTTHENKSSKSSRRRARMKKSAPTFGSNEFG